MAKFLKMLACQKLKTYLGNLDFAIILAY